jgi:hypothetical protein
MWFLVQVVRGSKHYEPDSQVNNLVLISDTTEMVISAKGLGTDGYRFEARKGNETFVVSEFRGSLPAGALVDKFTELARQMGALALGGLAPG